MWGILENLNANNYIGNKELIQPIITIGRSRKNTIIINDNRVSKIHCKIEYLSNQILLTDHSQNGTYLNNMKVGKDNQLVLKDNDIITLLRKQQVQEQYVSFKFKKTQINQRRKLDTQMKNEIYQKESKNSELEDKLGEEMICTICSDYIYGAVTLIPCMHNFCGGCYSDWMKKNQKCPNCQSQPIGASKNIPFINIIEKYLEQHPEKKKSDELRKQLDTKNIFTNKYHEFKKDQPEVKSMLSSQCNIFGMQPIRRMNFQRRRSNSPHKIQFIEITDESKEQISIDDENNIF